MSFASARSAAFALALGAIFVFTAASSTRAQDTEHDWQKEYPVSGGSPSLTIETADSSLDIHSCGDCKAIRIHVHSGEKLSMFRLEERQEQDHVYFTLKEKMHVGIGVHVNWKNKETQVTVETPASLNLDAKTADGNLAARNLTGTLQVHSGDGNVLLEDVRGSLRLTSADGNISIHNATGTLEARASDGQIKIDGQFTAVQLHTSDGNLDFVLASGSQLTTASHIESSDGRISIRVPQNLAADLDVSTSDGQVDCALPLTMDHYSSDQSSKGHLRGRLNAGGVPFSIHTSDGNVNIAAL